MKTTVLGMLFILLPLGVFSQKITRQQLINSKKEVLKNAEKYADADAYKNALFDLIVLDKEHATAWKDSLAVLYFRAGRFGQAILLTDELLKQDPDNEKYWEIQAQSYEALGRIKKAIEWYEKLAERHPDDVVILYRLAWNQYSIKRSEEAFATLRKINPDSIPAEVKVNLPAAPGKTQAVPLKAAYYNLLGLVSYDLHNLDMAIQFFDKALKEFPSFVSAKQNKAALEVMKAKLSGKNNTQNQQAPPSGK